MCLVLLYTTIENHNYVSSFAIHNNLRMRKWLLICGYNPDKKEISNFLVAIENILNELCLK